jgi:hypothetical protein
MVLGPAQAPFPERPLAPWPLVPLVILLRRSAEVQSGS